MTEDTTSAPTGVPRRIPINVVAAPSRRRRTERILAVVALLVLVAAWVAGGFITDVDLDPFIAEAMPAADRFEEVGAGLFEGYAGDTLVGYAAVGAADGYGGPLEVAVGVDVEGMVTGVSVVSEKETASYIRRVEESGMIGDFVGMPAGAEFEVGVDVDGVSGATYTSAGLADAVFDGVQVAAGDGLGLEVAERPAPKVVIGFAEVLLVVLFAIGFLGRRPFKYQRQLRWVTLIIGLIFIGFVLNSPLTISRIASFLLGYWPEWQTNLYWYMLVGGILFVFTVDNKNAYCHWFCPFGAAQDVLGVVGGAKYQVPKAWRMRLRWILRGLAFLAIAIAFLFRNPGLSSYEVFGTLFDLSGSAILFVLLGIVMLASLFLQRPWCRYLCPLDPIYQLIKAVRAWIKEIWQRLRQRLAGSPN